MALRCHHLGLIAGLALALSASASEWSSVAPGTPTVVAEQAAFQLVPERVSLPVPAPLLFIAGGLLALVATVRWRQHLRD